MTYPVPERLAPIRREVRLSQGVAMLALIAALCFILAFFNLDPFGGHSLVALGLFFVAVHLAYPIAIPRPNRA